MVSALWVQIAQEWLHGPGPPYSRDCSRCNGKKKANDGVEVLVEGWM